MNPTPCPSLAPTGADGPADLAPRRARWWAVAAALLVLGLLLHTLPLNQAWMQAVHARSLLPEGLWAALTLLGFGWPLVILVCAFDRGPGRSIAALLHAAWISALLTHGPKLALAAPRPASVLPEAALQVIGEPVHRLGSLPSGHALAVCAVLTVLWFTRPAWRRPDRALFGPLVLLAAGVAWSRVAVGAHWPADVLAGAGLGLMAGLLAVQAERAWPLARGLASRPGQRLVAALELGAGAAWLITHSGYPSVNLLQGALVALAFASGLWRWRGVALGADDPAPADAPPVRPSGVAW